MREKRDEQRGEDAGGLNGMDSRNYSNAYLVEPAGRNLREEWEDEVRGGENIWERAIKYTQKVVRAPDLFSVGIH